MPELPEVEAVRLAVEPALVGRRVDRVTVHRRDVVVGPGDPPGGFARNRRAGTPEGPKPRLPRALLLEGGRIERVRRHGKQLAIVGDGGVLVVHLGMTGGLECVAPGARTSSGVHVHVTWRLNGGGRLLFRDPRRFGGVWLIESETALEDRWNRTLGPDALAAHERTVADRVPASTRSIKAALLDQRTVAGLGNIYADEALHAACLHPARACAGLRREERLGLARAIGGILRQAVKAGGSTIRDFASAPDTPGGYQRAHRVYGRAGGACFTCDYPLESGVIAGRTSVWCPRCQPDE